MSRYSGYTYQWLIGDGQHRGSMTMLESEPYFADNDLGDGAKIDLLLTVCDGVVVKCPVVIQWTDWNRFAWVQI